MWSSSIRRNFGLSGSVYKHCASWLLTRLSEDVPNLSLKNCVLVQAFLVLSDSVNSSYQKGISANGSLASCVSSLKDFCPSFLVASSSLRSITESEDELDAVLFPETSPALGSNDSCSSVVEDELLPELTEKPGTTRGTKLSVLEWKWNLMEVPRLRSGRLSNNKKKLPIQCSIDL